MPNIWVNSHFFRKLLFGHTRTQQLDCSTRTTKVADNPVAAPRHVTVFFTGHKTTSSNGLVDLRKASSVASAIIKEAGTHNSAKTYAGEIRRPAASGREGVTHGKPGVASIACAAGITAQLTYTQQQRQYCVLSEDRHRHCDLPLTFDLFTSKWVKVSRTHRKQLYLRFVRWSQPHRFVRYRLKKTQINRRENPTQATAVGVGKTNDLCSLYRHGWYSAQRGKDASNDDLAWWHRYVETSGVPQIPSEIICHRFASTCWLLPSICVPNLKWLSVKLVRSRDRKAFTKLISGHGKELKSIDYTAQCFMVTHT